MERGLIPNTTLTKGLTAVFGVRFYLPLLQNLVFRQFLQLFWYFDFPSASVMAFTTKEIVWLRWLLADIRVSLSHPTLM